MKRMHHIDYECKKPDADALKAYQDFMCDPANEFNCSECQERGVNRNDYGLPCGQQSCCVACHCNHCN